MTFVDIVSTSNIILVIWQVHAQTYFLLAFMMGIVWNQFTNSLIKVFFKEPRPSNIHYNDDPVEKYGMPSGHTQHVVFCVTFLFLLHKNACVVFVSLVIALHVAFQRFFSKAHTIKQIVAGACIGALNAWIFVNTVKKFLAKS